MPFKTIPWLRLFSLTSVLLEAMQPEPSVANVCAVIPLPLSTRRRLPAASKIIPRAVINPPKTLTAAHPGATSPGYCGAATPGQDAGMETCARLVGTSSGAFERRTGALMSIRAGVE